MSFVVAAPEVVVAAASDLAGIGSAIGAANAAAAVPTMGVLAAGADEVSAAVADLFGAHAQAYQALSAQAALFHEQFVHAMTAGAGPMPVPRRRTPPRWTCSTGRFRRCSAAR
ncbi:PE-PGRS family protein PE_PGRS34 [Mycobacterium tuberculosis]|nr:PE-PGRS family protein PE_PGRS34 [Mycobacterium tuberculosis]